MDTEMPEPHSERPSRQVSQADASQVYSGTSKPAPRRIRPAFLVLQGLIAMAIVFGAGVIMQRMLADREPPRQRPVREQVFTVQTVPVQRGDFQPEIQVFGTVIVGNVIELRTELAGPLIAVHPDLRNGAVLAAGTVIAELDPFEFETAASEAEVDILDGEARLLEAEARLAAAGTDVENAVAQLELAERDVERAQALVARGSVTQQTLDQRQQALLQSKASVDSARATLKVEEAKLAQQRAALKRLQLARDRAERDLTLTRLVAPTDVIIESESVSLGQVVTANQTIAQLIDLSSMEVQFTLSDGQYGRLTETDSTLLGSEITVQWNVGSRRETVEATVTRIASSIATDRGGVTLFADIQNLPSDTDLRPGAFVEVNLPDRVYANSVLVPETALYDEQRIYIAEEGRLKSIPVSVLAFSGTDVILQADLEDGARVLTTRISEVGEGLRVREAGATAPDDANPKSPGDKPGDRKTRSGSQ
jgi:multidrug resistance efflux pump